MERLREFERRVLATGRADRLEGYPEGRSYVGHDVAVAILLDRDDAQRERARKSRQKFNPPVDSTHTGE